MLTVPQMMIEAYKKHMPHILSIQDITRGGAHALHV